MEKKDYKSLYYKYKNKYLKLKEYLGGSLATEQAEFARQDQRTIDISNTEILNGISGKLFIPCEITNYTKNLYISQDLFFKPEFSEFKELFRSLIKWINNRPSHYFMQDPYILLKDTSNNDYAIEVRSGYDGFNSNLKILKYNSQEITNHFGGNFISAPNKKIFTIDNTYLQDTIGPYLLEEPIVLNCSFQTNGRHIDELMCFMPDGQNDDLTGKYKIWFYYIDELVLDDSMPDIDEVRLEFEKYKLSKSTKPYKVEIAERTNRVTGKVVPAHTEINPYKIDEDTLIPDIDFLDIPEFQKKFPSKSYFVLHHDLKGTSVDIPTVESLREKLNIEINNNLDKICEALYGGSYRDNSNSNNFLCFPINLHCEIIPDLDKLKLSWNITSIPIFNRLLVETDTLRYCVFPKGACSEKVKAILDDKKSDIKSCINSEEFIIIDIDTNEFNQGIGAVGGNVHCLIKNQY